MNAKVDQAEKSPDLVTIEVDGVTLEVRKGAMVIEATDAADISVPRFCYHKKLSIAANCRMCLVEVERAPKPLPACATPVAEGMRVFTRSAKARAAQKGVMEFLLINHPLDCPICDQGGECELQDLSIGYGRGVSRFTERKRVVEDENLGPLISTEMTRCIHCTRCVRFLDEIGGQRELGGIGRGEHTTISTYVGAGVRSELSGNIIDLCPVGALTSKPFRFTARAWELLSHDAVAPHDAVGSNIHLHHMRGQIKRVVPRENEDVNETWIADRDRFSYEGIYAEDRLPRPLVKVGGEWQEADWEVALDGAARGLRETIERHGAEAFGALVAPTSTVEEMYLLGRIMRALGVTNIDHRLRQADFSDDTQAAVPSLGMALADAQDLRGALLVGADVRSEAPMLNLRLRKAALQGARIAVLNPRRVKPNFAGVDQEVVAPGAMVERLAAVAKALLEAKGEGVPQEFAALLDGVSVDDTARAKAELLGNSPAAVLVGAMVESHPQGAALRALAALVARLAGAVYGQVPSAANSVGGWYAGAVPHREVGAAARDTVGLNARAMLEQPRRGYVVFGAEPELDAFDPAVARNALNEAEFVLVMSPYATPEMAEYADIILPIGAFGETAGTYVNLEGRWQSGNGVGRPQGEARPAWRVLRVLGNLLDLEGFEYQGVDEVLDELRSRVAEAQPAGQPGPGSFELAAFGDGYQRVGDVPIYRTDAVVRRAGSLQATVLNPPAAAYLSQALADELGVAEGDRLRASQGAGSAELPVVIDDGVPAGCVRIPAALPETVRLGPMLGAVQLERA